MLIMIFVHVLTFYINVPCLFLFYLIVTLTSIIFVVFLSVKTQCSI